MLMIKTFQCQYLNNMKEKELEKKLKRCSVETLFHILPRSIDDYSMNAPSYFILNEEDETVGYAYNKHNVQVKKYTVDFSIIGLKQALVRLILLCVENNYLNQYNVIELIKRESSNDLRKNCGIVLVGFIMMYLIIAFINLDALWVVHTSGFVRFISLALSAIIIGIGFAINDTENG